MAHIVHMGTWPSLERITKGALPLPAPPMLSVRTLCAEVLAGPKVAAPFLQGRRPARLHLQRARRPARTLTHPLLSSCGSRFHCLKKSGRYKNITRLADREAASASPLKCAICFRCSGKEGASGIVLKVDAGEAVIVHRNGAADVGEVRRASDAAEVDVGIVGPAILLQPVVPAEAPLTARLQL